MSKKILQIVESAYRGTLEEQDDTIVWLSHAMKGAGGDLVVLLKGNAVNYLNKDQDASGLRFGHKQQTQPPRLAADVAQLADKKVPVLYVEEDARRLGLEASDLIDGPKAVKKQQLPGLFAEYDLVCYW